ncbi:hypothetical protein CC80DRAFT_489127 [Byssothecium circinans]|uniref:Peptidase A1 domain-containing protein n=1 Tax=Byssothecium circinans TaxID=147558 RepID=A0A6A5U894_9PLEO|nr:hypothetical protein CC80DRAFT_489127 [Byssothecium circinans]
MTDDRKFDTVLGLALYESEGSSNFSAPGPFQQMISQGLLRENFFSLTLPRTDDENGEIVFGGFPETVERDRWWEFF